MTRLIERISLGRAFGVDRLRADSTDRPRRGGAGIGGGYPAYFAFCAKGRGRFPIRTGKGASGKDFFAAMPLCSNEIPRKCGESFACGIVGRAEKRNVFYSCPASGCFSKCRDRGAFSAFRFPPPKSARSERSFLRLCKPLFFVAKHMKLRYCKNGRIFKDSER